MGIQRVGHSASWEQSSRPLPYVSAAALAIQTSQAYGPKPFLTFSQVVMTFDGPHPAGDIRNASEKVD